MTVEFKLDMPSVTFDPLSCE